MMVLLIVLFLILSVAVPLILGVVYEDHTINVDRTSAAQFGLIETGKSR